MKPHPIFEFPNDPRLTVAYSTYEDILDRFNHFTKRQPSCEIFIGITTNKVSTITAYTNNTAGEKDVATIRDIAQDIANDWLK